MVSDILKKYYGNEQTGEMDSKIEEWLEWYKGEVETFHNYTIFNGVSCIGHSKLMLGMAKTICEDWSSLIMNEKVSICSKEFDELDYILEKNNFLVKSSELIELTFALGTGAFVEWLDSNEEVRIDYIRGEMIFPISWRSGEITECAFGSIVTVDGEQCYYVQAHTLENGHYVINNHIEAIDGTKQIENPYAPKVYTLRKEPFFQIIRPNIVNNIDLDSPMGISVFGNAIPQIKGTDNIYDSYMNEYVLGKKRIMIPISLAKSKMMEDGTEKPIFDTNDLAYYGLRDGDKIEEINMEIRADSHDKGMQTALNLLSLKCGLGFNRYMFNNGVIKTTSEVISSKSDLYKNLKKHEKIIESALIKMIKSIGFLSKKDIGDVVISFDDSIIEDTGKTISNNVTLLSARLQTKTRALMEIHGISEDVAISMISEINAENDIGNDFDGEIDD